MIALLAAFLFRAAAYVGQSASGAPLIVSGHIDTAAVRTLAAFDDVTLELTPFAEDVSGWPAAAVPLMLRHYNPRIRLWLYALVGDQWLPPGFKPQPWDRSGFAEIYLAVDRTGGWLYGTDGQQWLPDYRVDLGNRATADSLAAVYVRLLGSHLFDGLFMDDAATSIAWTSHGQRQLDYRRAGFRSLADMDSARQANVGRIVRAVHRIGRCLAARNGTGPNVGEDVDFREGLGGVTSVADARVWMQTPGAHWLEADCFSPDECSSLRAVAHSVVGRRRAILSLGPSRGWPPLKP